MTGALLFDDAGPCFVVEMRQPLLAWYDANRRELPWRRNTDPYAILVSEIMCQQTRVDVVAPYFERWMAKWPAAADLAQASEDEVVAAWSGLGYYNRARNLHAAAQRIARDGWPDDLQDLPGSTPAQRASTRSTLPSTATAGWSNAMLASAPAT